jgi:hypothetical protein
MMKWFIQKMIVGKLNSLLANYNDNVQSVRVTILQWITRLEKILANLKSLCSRLDDNTLSEDEIEQTIDELKQTIKEF